MRTVECRPSERKSAKKIPRKSRYISALWLHPSTWSRSIGVAGDLSRMELRIAITVALMSGPTVASGKPRIHRYFLLLWFSSSSECRQTVEKWCLYSFLVFSCCTTRASKSICLVERLETVRSSAEREFKTVSNYVVMEASILVSS